MKLINIFQNFNDVFHTRRKVIFTELAKLEGQLGSADLHQGPVFYDMLIYNHYIVYARISYSTVEIKHIK